MKRIVVAALLLLIGNFGCGRNFEWLPEYENRSTATSTFARYSAVFVSTKITDLPEDSMPQALVVGNGSVYAVDSTHNRVLTYNATTGVYTAKFGTLGTAEGRFTAPSGIAFLGSEVYVADFPNVAQIGFGRIQAFTLAGTSGSSLAERTFQHVYALAARNLNSIPVIYATEVNTGRILAFNRETLAIESSWGGTGSGTGELLTPHGIAADSAGSIYVSDTGNNRIQRFGSTGTNPMIFNHTGDGALNTPEGIAVSNGGEVFVADSKRNRVAVFSTAGIYKTSFGTSGSGKGQFSIPVGVAVDSSGAIYVSDSTGRIQKFIRTY